MTAIPISELFAPATPAQWLQQILDNAQTLELPTTAWQAGGRTRTILAIVANLLAQEDAIVSGMAQAGFLDYAASGSVTYITPDGNTVTQPVTPDPSIPSQNPTGALGWLDVLGSSVYNVQRVGAAPASNVLAIANASLNTYGPYAPGSYHVANPATGATYGNVSSLTINPGVAVGGGITAASNTTPIQVTTSTPHGLATGAVVQIAGVVGNTAANGIWPILVTSATQFTLQGSMGSGVYSSGGTVLPCQVPQFAADVAGPTGSAGIGAIKQPVTAAQGVTVYNWLPFVGAAWESNTAFAARCRLKLQSLSPNGPSGAYLYFALTALPILAALTPSFVMSQPVTKVLKQASTTTGVVNVYVANASGPVTGCVQTPVTAASNATPIAVTTSAAHGLSTGQQAIIQGVLGNTNANGTWTLTVTGANTFTLNGSTGNGAYTGGGQVEGGDLGGVDYVLQTNVVPDSVTEVTQSASTFNVAIVATVVVPQGYVPAYQAAVQSALALYFASLPIGGASGGAVQYNDIVGVLWAAGSVNGAQSYVLSIPTLTLNGASGNLAYPSPTAVATLSPAPVITVQGT